MTRARGVVPAAVLARYACAAMQVLLSIALATSLGIQAGAGPERDTAAAPRAEPPVVVYVLAGQSNMEGKAQVALLQRQLDAPATRELFAHLHDDGEWRVRDDVSIRFLDRGGPLTVGFGSPGRIGPELGFGHVVGDHHEAKVLLIKTAWGGKSLFEDFRSPSAGLPDDAVLDRELEKARAKKPATTRGEIEAGYGEFYRRMIAEVRSTLADLAPHVPGYAGQGHVLAGFVWFQGWNDMIDTGFTAAYAGNLAHFIRDVRRDLGAARLPFVIGQLGVDGTDDRGDLRANPKRLAFKRAQASVAELEEFAGDVALVRTDVFWDMAADAVFRKGWKEHREEWDQLGSDMPYHYLGSPSTMVQIGAAFARAVLELESERR